MKARSMSSTRYSAQSALDTLVTAVEKNAVELRRELATTRETLRSIRERHAALRSTIEGLSPPVPVPADGITEAERLALDAIDDDTLTGRALFDALCTARELVARARESGADCEQFAQLLESAASMRKSIASDVQWYEGRIATARTRIDALRRARTPQEMTELEALLVAAASVVDETRRWLARPARAAPESLSDAQLIDSELREQRERLDRARSAMTQAENITDPPDYSSSSDGGSSGSYSSDSSSSISYDSYSYSGGGGSDTSGGSGDW
jgi:uncharacterized membrane protein YgcG